MSIESIQGFCRDLFTMPEDPKEYLMSPASIATAVFSTGYYLQSPDWDLPGVAVAALAGEALALVAIKALVTMIERNESNLPPVNEIGPELAFAIAEPSLPQQEGPR